MDGVKNKSRAAVEEHNRPKGKVMLPTDAHVQCVQTFDGCC